MQYVLCELEKVKVEYPEYAEATKRLLTKAIDRAKEIWPGFTYGGIYPGTKQFGITSALPKFFGSTTTHLPTFRQNFTATGWQDIFNLTVAEDIIIGGMGWAITSPTINITELRAEISDVKYPRVNIEEMQAYDQPAVILKQGWYCQEEKAFLLRGYIEATGHQRVVPVSSFTIYKKKDDVIKE